MTWSAAQYTKFEDERTRPARDLLAQVPNQPVARAVDLGCGPANSTALLAARFPQSAITGIDSAPDMIDAARARLPGARFVLGDITNWQDDGAAPDVIFANAALQWVPGHATLLPALLARLAPGGSLAVQMPDNLQEPSHILMREVAGAQPWQAKLAQAAAARTNLPDADWYFRLLRDAGARVNIWRTTYFHPLAGGAAAVVEWVKGTGLRPFIDPLNPAERDAFLARYTAEIAAAYPAQPDGTVLLAFPRLFFVATLPAPAG